MMNRRKFFKIVTGFIGGVYAAFVPDTDGADITAAREALARGEFRPLEELNEPVWTHCNSGIDNKCVYVSVFEMWDDEPFSIGMEEVDKLTAEIEARGRKYKHSLSHVILPRERYKRIVAEARGAELGRTFTEGWKKNIYIWSIPVYPYDGLDTVFGFDL